MENRIKALRTQLGLTQKALADRAGCLQQDIQQLETGRRKLTAAYMAQIAPALGVPPADLRAAPAADTAPNARMAPPGLALPPFAAMPRDLPVRGAAECGEDGVFDFSTTSDLAIDLIRRPPGLAGMNTVFALYAVGESMIPWREPGDPIFVHPDRQPRPGAYVVVVLRPEEEHGPARALVKRLVRRTATEVVLAQFNPAKEFAIPAARVQAVMRVIDWVEAYGIA